MMNNQVSEFEVVLNDISEVFNADNQEFNWPECAPAFLKKQPIKSNNLNKSI